MSTNSATERMLLGSDPYTSKTLIRLYGGYRNSIANDLFNKCKEIEAEKNDIDLRPGHVLKSTFFKVAGINLSQEIRRYKENIAKSGKTKETIR